MLRTLRGRLIASHMLLLLIVIPLVGLALVYVLESRVVLANLARQLASQGVLIAEMLNADPLVWQDRGQAAAFVTHIDPLFPAKLTLLAPDGVVLASSDPEDAGLIGRRVTLQGLAEAAGGQPTSRVRYSRDARAEVAEIMAPARDAAGRVVGIVRLTDRLGSVAERFTSLRLLIAGVLAVGLALGALLGLALAVTVERPLESLTREVEAYTAGGNLAALPEAGPLETRRLHRAFRRMDERLRSLEEARRQMLANLLHEVGRPLGSLRAAGRALLDGADADAGLRRELLAGMDDEIGRMEALLDDIADLRDRAAAGIELHRRPVALGEWLPQVLAPWREAARGAGLRWETDIAGDLPTVEVDPDRLAQALGNLLSNAIKFTPGRSLTRGRDHGRERGGRARLVVPHRRHRPRHPAGGAGPHLRAVLPLPARPPLPAGAGRGPHHRPRHRRRARRHAHGGERGRRRRGVCGAFEDLTGLGVGKLARVQRDET